MKRQRQNDSNAGNIRFEFSEIEKLRNTDNRESIDNQTLTKNMGGLFTLICC